MEERHGWVLATFLQRLVAHLIDAVLSQLPLLVMILALLGAVFVSVESRDPEPLEADGNGLRGVLIGVVLVSLAVLAGYVIWWLFALRRGQTPGKQVVGIRVVKDNGEPSDWGYTSCGSSSSRGCWAAFFRA